MKFNEVINEGLTTPAAIKLVNKAVKALGKNANREKIKNYIKNNIVRNKQHYDANVEGIEAAISAFKKGHI